MVTPGYNGRFFISDCQIITCRKKFPFLPAIMVSCFMRRFFEQFFFSELNFIERSHLENFFSLAEAFGTRLAHKFFES